MRTITAEQVRAAVHAADPEAPVEVLQTGGGCATVFVGTPTGPDQRYWLSIGPGSYDWGEPWKSDFYLEDMSIGHDDNGESGSTIIDELEQITAYMAARRA